MGVISKQRGVQLLQVRSTLWNALIARLQGCGALPHKLYLRKSGRGWKFYRQARLVRSENSNEPPKKASLRLCMFSAGIQWQHCTLFRSPRLSYLFCFSPGWSLKNSSLWFSFKLVILVPQWQITPCSVLEPSLHGERSQNLIPIQAFTEECKCSLKNHTSYICIVIPVIYALPRTVARTRIWVCDNTDLACCGDSPAPLFFHVACFWGSKAGLGTLES